jgi:hypothetical protein
MVIARKLAIDELHITESALPLDNLDNNFIVGDALVDESGGRVTWPKADVIIGNPPFLSSKKLKPERGVAYTDRVRKAYKDVPGMADYCVYWFRKANDSLSQATTGDPFSGRAGLVGTQNIRNNKSRVGGLDAIAASGTIVEAVQNQQWSGEANVHVSIVNWIKTHEVEILPDQRRLWTETRIGRGKDLRREMDVRLVEHINSSLTDDVDVSSRAQLAANKKPKRSFQGKTSGYEEFRIAPEEVATFNDSLDILKPFLIGREILGEEPVSRWVIDFGAMEMLEAASDKSAFEHCRRFVLPKIQEKLAQTEAEGGSELEGRRVHVDSWWRFWRHRGDMDRALAGLSRFIACSRVSRRPIMVFLPAGVCASDALQVFAFEDDYSFGVLQSEAHFEWFRTSSRLKEEADIRYSTNAVFNTFPWPQSPSVGQVDAVAEAGRVIRTLRAEAGAAIHGGLRALYRTLDVPGQNRLRDAHRQLDAAVFDAYGFGRSHGVLGSLLDLNHYLAEQERLERTITGPGVPPSYKNHSALVTSDTLFPLPKLGAA